jgi:hypothetical protein
MVAVRLIDSWDIPVLSRNPFAAFRNSMSVIDRIGDSVCRIRCAVLPILDTRARSLWMDVSAP